ncbi:hypothetical protein FRB99_005163 [Tulasnella sp. 403]|nr:hypothetical protein FRB99_005163 [Tulasnella sp. 403]
MEIPCEDISPLDLPNDFGTRIGIPGAFPDGKAADVEVIGAGGGSCVYGIVWQGRYVAAVKATPNEERRDAEVLMLELVSFPRYKFVDTADAITS